MKLKYVRLGGLAVLWSGLALGAAAHTAPVPADTVAGQAHFVRLMSTGMCTKLTQESQKADLSKLSPTESEDLLKKLMLATMGDNFSEFSALLEKAGKGAAEATGRAIGEQAVLDLVQNCPSAAPLIARASSGRVTGGVEMTAAERSVLLPITQDACQRLDAENAKQPLAQRTPAQRTAVFEQVMQGLLLSHSEALKQQYGEEVLESVPQAQEVGKKIGLLMIETCPAYIVQAGRDQVAQQREAASTAPAKSKAVPTKKALVKTKASSAKVR